MIVEVVLAELERSEQPGVVDSLVELQGNRGSRSYRVRTRGPTLYLVHDYGSRYLGDAIRTAALRMDCTDDEVAQAVRERLCAITAA